MNFHHSCINELRKTKSLVERAITQLDDKQMHWQADPEANSIAIIMKHMAGNMLSRWTDFLTSDGEKPDRNRDGEFVDQFKSREELMTFWERGWARTFEAIEALTPADLEKTVMIRSEPHTVPLAIIRQVGHYAQHAGQIVFIAKHIKGAEWKTLSLPKKR